MPVLILVFPDTDRARLPGAFQGFYKGLPHRHPAAVQPVFIAANIAAKAPHRFQIKNYCRHRHFFVWGVYQDSAMESHSFFGRKL